MLRHISGRLLFIDRTVVSLVLLHFYAIIHDDCRDTKRCLLLVVDWSTVDIFLKSNVHRGEKGLVVGADFAITHFDDYIGRGRGKSYYFIMKSLLRFSRMRNESAKALYCTDFPFVLPIAAPSLFSHFLAPCFEIGGADINPFKFKRTDIIVARTNMTGEEKGKLMRWCRLPPYYFSF